MLFGDMFFVFKCWVVNIVVKYVKKLVFFYYLEEIMFFMLVVKKG